MPEHVHEWDLDMLPIYDMTFRRAVYHRRCRLCSRVEHTMTKGEWTRDEELSRD